MLCIYSLGQAEHPTLLSIISMLVGVDLMFVAFIFPLTHTVDLLLLSDGGGQFQGVQF